MAPFMNGKAMPQFLGATNAQLSTRIKALETWKATAVSEIAALKTKVAALEAKPAGTDYSVQIAALVTRMNTIEAKVCPQESRIAALEADHIPD